MIEQTLERIALALERIANREPSTLAQTQTTLPPNEPTPINSARRGRRSAPAADSTGTDPAGAQSAAAAALVNTNVHTSGATALPEYQTVREAILKLAEKKGHAAAVGVLAKFGVKTGRELQPAQYAEALKAIAAA